MAKSGKKLEKMEVGEHMSGHHGNELGKMERNMKKKGHHYC